MNSCDGDRPYKSIGILFILIALFGIQLSPVHAWVNSAALAARSTSLGSLTLTGVHPRIFTPNGDGANDKVRFEFDNVEMLPVEGTVYDLRGARVASLTPGTDPYDLLLWDGKDSDGRVVAGGIYIYQIEFQGEHATGTVVVAR
jgi:hypothetical protein